MMTREERSQVLLASVSIKQRKHTRCNKKPLDVSKLRSEWRFQSSSANTRAATKQGKVDYGLTLDMFQSSSANTRAATLEHRRIEHRRLGFNQAAQTHALQLDETSEGLRIWHDPVSIKQRKHTRCNWNLMLLSLILSSRGVSIKQRKHTRCNTTKLNCPPLHRGVSIKQRKHTRCNHGGPIQAHRVLHIVSIKQRKHTRCNAFDRMMDSHGFTLFQSSSANTRAAT